MSGLQRILMILVLGVATSGLTYVFGPKLYGYGGIELQLETQTLFLPFRHLSASAMFLIAGLVGLFVKAPSLPALGTLGRGISRRKVEAEADDDTWPPRKKADTGAGEEADAATGSKATPRHAPGPYRPRQWR